MCNKSEAFLAVPAVCGIEGSDCVTTLHCNYGDAMWHRGTVKHCSSGWRAHCITHPSILLCIQTFRFYRNVVENKFGFHKSFNEFGLGLGQNYQQFLKLPSTRFCLFTGALTQSRILSPDNHKTKMSINLKILKILCTTSHSASLGLYVKAQEQSHLTSIQTLFFIFNRCENIRVCLSVCQWIDEIMINCNIYLVI